MTKKQKQKLIQYIVAIIIALATFIHEGYEKLTNNKVDREVTEQIENYENKLQVHYIDVGQGDAILLVSPSKKTMLIDAGENDDEELIVNYIKKQGIDKLDYVVGTHPHADHIGGLDNVIRKLNIGDLYMPKVVHTTKTYESVINEARKKDLKIKGAKAGVEFLLDEDISVSMFSPKESKYKELNNYSPIMKVTYKDTSFLFTGDAEREVEEEVIDAGYDISANVLKVGHHGSTSSTTDKFLGKVNPSIAVIQVGKDNKYGHPHDETIKKLMDMGVEILRTDVNGDIILLSDGETLYKKVSK